MSILEKILNKDGWEFTLQPNENFNDLIENEEVNNHDNNPPKNIILPSNKLEKIKSSMKSIHDAGKIKKLLVKEGDGKMIPNSCNIVNIKYRGHFMGNQKPFDVQNDEDESVDLQSLILGLQFAIKTMRKGEIAFFAIDPELAYGPLGHPPMIPPNTEVLYSVNLLNFKNLTENRSAFCDMETEAQNLTKKAAEYFKQKEFNKAIETYKKLLKKLEKTLLFSDEQEMKMNKMMYKTDINLMINYNKLNEFQETCIIFNSLNSETINEKAVYHYAKALLAMDRFDDALENIIHAQRMMSCSTHLNTKFIKFAGEIVEQKYQKIWKCSNRLEYLNKIEEKKRTLEEYKKAEDLRRSASVSD